MKLPLIALLVVGLVVGVGVFIFLPTSSIGDTNFYLCADEALVDDPAKCPPGGSGSVTKAVTFHTSIVVVFADGTSDVVTENTAFSSLSAYYKDKRVAEFRYSVSLSTEGDGASVAYRGEVVLTRRPNILVLTESSQLLETNLIPAHTTVPLFTMTINADKFFASVASGELYMLSFITHIDLTVHTTATPDGNVVKKGDIRYDLDVVLLGEGGGGGGGGGCAKPDCIPVPRDFTDVA